MSRLWDVLIAGGGPAGAALAVLCARQGLATCVVERAKFPRDKVCGEFVSSEGLAVLQRLGLSEAPRLAGAPLIERWALGNRRGATVRGRLPRFGGAAAARGLSRSRLDATLLGAAAGAGARVLERHAVGDVLVEDGRACGLVVRARGGSRARVCRARLVVGADGRRSRVQRRLVGPIGDPQRSGPGAWFGLKTHLDGEATSLVELHQFPEGYAGLAPVERRRTNLCLLVTVRGLRAAGGDLDRLVRSWTETSPGLAALIEGHRRCGRWHAIGPLRFGPRARVAAGALFVGDAAGTIDPFCGEGIANALRCAELAAPTVQAAAAAGALPAEAARAYDAAWRREFGPVVRRTRWMGRLLERPGLGGALIGGLRRFGGPLLPRLAAASRTGVRDVPAG